MADPGSMTGKTVLMPQVAGVSGRYFADRKARTTSKASYDTAAAVRLWQVSDDLVGLPLSVPNG